MGANSMTGTQSIAAFSTGVSSGSGQVYDFTGTRTRVPVTQASNGWTDTVMNRLQDLIHLPMG